MPQAAPVYFYNWKEKLIISSAPNWLIKLDTERCDRCISTDEMDPRNASRIAWIIFGLSKIG